MQQRSLSCWSTMFATRMKKTKDGRVVVLFCDDRHRFCFYRDLEDTKGIAVFCFISKVVFGALIAAGTLGLMQVIVSVYLLDRFLSFLK